MWRSMIQTQCDHGTWNTPYGEWYGEPSDPFWFKPDTSDIEFTHHAMSLGVEIRSEVSEQENFPGYLNWKEGSAWFAISLEQLPSYPFRDPRYQLGELTKALTEAAEDVGLPASRVRLVMYQTPKQ